MKPDLYIFITRMFNSALINNPELKRDVDIYKGSIITIELTNTKTNITLTIADSGIEVSDNIADAPDLTIRATPLELINYFSRVNQNSAQRSGNIEISGNISLAQKLQSVFVKFEIDWEEKFSEIIGDEISHSIFFALGRFVENFNHGKKELINNFAEFIKYENDMVVSEHEIEDFNKSIDRLRDDVEKLNFRLNRINQSIGVG